MATWQAAEAQAHFSEVIDKALHEGPQTIADNGAGVVVVSEALYRLLTERKPTFKEHLLNGPKVDDFTIKPQPTFVSFLLDGPLVDDFTIERDPDTGRDFEF